MENSNVTNLIESMFRGMDGFVTSKTVVGEPIVVGDATLIPLMEVSCGMGAGGFDQKKKEKGNGDAGAGAMSSKITPTAILILQNGKSKLVNVKNQDTMTKILDMVPELLDRFTGGNRVSKEAEAQAEAMLEAEEAEQLS